jgi:copper transport protein
VALAVLGAGLSFLVPTAAAHALLVGSQPAAGASLARAPRQLTLTFTEAPDPSLSSVQLLNATGRLVSGVSSARPRPGHPAELYVTVARGLTDGVYTVHWRTVSTVDGHVAESSFPFGVGVVASARPGGTAGSAGTSTSLSALQSAGRWLLYWGLALFVGAAAVSWLVLGGRIPSSGRSLLAIAWLLCAVGTSTMTLAERSIVGVGLGSFLSASAGGAFVAQAVAVLVCGAAVGAFALRPGSWTIAAVGVAGAAALLVHVHGGHADGPSPFRPLDLAVQWAHASAVGVWIGGLVWLLLDLRGRGRGERAGAVRAFSSVAAVALAVVLATGLARAVAEVGTLGDLVHTSFGLTLMVKVALVVVLVSLGALNRYRVVPALSGDAATARRFGRVSRAEIVVAAAVLGATAVLTGLTPSTFSAAARAAAGHRIVASASDYATTVTVRLTVTPGLVGGNVFVAQVDRYGTDTPAPARRVTLEFTLPAHVGLGASLALRRGAGGTWTGAGLQLSIIGDWSVDAVIRGAATAVVVPFTVRVPSQ